MYFDQCDEAKALGFALKLIMDEKVHAIIGPACPTGKKKIIFYYKN